MTTRPCPICTGSKHPKAIPCGGLCYHGTVTVEKVARDLADEEARIAWAEVGKRRNGVSEEHWLKYRDQYIQNAIEYLDQLQQIYSPSATGPGGVSEQTKPMTSGEQQQ